MHDTTILKSDQLTKQCVGNAALFAVACRLSLMGWNVLITSRNARGPDLYFMDRQGKAQAVQVKGIQNGRKSNVNGFRTDGAEESGCKWWIIVRNVGREDEEFFILDKREVIAARNRWGWSKPLAKRKNAWKRIGLCPNPA